MGAIKYVGRKGQGEQESGLAFGCIWAGCKQQVAGQVQRSEPPPTAGVSGAHKLNMGSL